MVRAGQGRVGASVALHLRWRSCAMPDSPHAHPLPSPLRLPARRCAVGSAPAAAVPAGLHAAAAPPRRRPAPQMHLNGLEDSEKDGFLKKFFGVVCPVAAAFEAKGRRLAVHWADSGEMRRETPAGAKRMAMPADACKNANVDYWVRRAGGGGADAGRAGLAAGLPRCKPLSLHAARLAWLTPAAPLPPLRRCAPAGWATEQTWRPTWRWGCALPAAAPAVGPPPAVATAPPPAVAAAAAVRLPTPPLLLPGAAASRPPLAAAPAARSRAPSRS